MLSVPHSNVPASVPIALPWEGQCTLGPCPRCHPVLWPRCRDIASAAACFVSAGARTGPRPHCCQHLSVRLLIYTAAGRPVLPSSLLIPAAEECLLAVQMQGGAPGTRMN